MCGRFYVSEAELDDFSALIEGIEKDLLKPRPNRDGSSDIVPGDFSPVLITDPEGSILVNEAGLPSLRACKETTCSMDFKKQRPDSPFFYEKEQGFSLQCLTVPVAMRAFSWGFPAAQGKGRIINARAETVMDKPLFRLPFSTQRCLVPAQGFYEWSDTPALATAAEQSGITAAEPEMLQMTMDGFLLNTPHSAVFSGKSVHPKSPRIRHRFTRIDRHMLFMAGLFWTFRSPARDNVTAFTILTVAANADVAAVHDRMPLILEEGDLRIWLTPGISAALAALMVPSAAGTLSREADPAD